MRKGSWRLQGGTQWRPCACWLAGLGAQAEAFNDSSEQGWCGGEFQVASGRPRSLVRSEVLVTGSKTGH